jgi:hypothetical protein
MTWQDPIVEEVRAIREAYAAQFNYGWSTESSDEVGYWPNDAL